MTSETLPPAKFHGRVIFHSPRTAASATESATSTMTRTLALRT